MCKKSVEVYAKLLKDRSLIDAIPQISQNIQINGLSSDSRRCGKGYLFFCKGENFLSSYAKQAEDIGACMFIYDQNSEQAVKQAALSKKSVQIKTYDIMKAMSVISEHFYGKPMEKLVTVAVTGTKGKTTAVCYINSVLNKHTNGKSAILNDMLKEDAPRLTTPEPIDLHQAAARALSLGYTHLICEISSQSLKLQRTYGITFDIAAFLNLGNDHISPKEHKSTEDYFLCKAMLFKSCKTAIVNTGDEFGRRLLSMLDEDIQKITFSLSDKNADYYAGAIRNESGGCDFKVYEKKNKSSFPIVTPTIGSFNALNALSAAAVCRTVCASEKSVFLGILSSHAVGRGELIESQDGKVTVIVDYAHNEMSFDAIFQAAKKYKKDSSVTAIFGCPGDKAHCRRKSMVHVCSQYADKAIICDDDSGKEGYGCISREIRQLFLCETSASDSRLKFSSVSFIESRKDSIEHALNLAYERAEKTVILFLGKGNETQNRTEKGDAACTSDIELAREAMNLYDSRVDVKRTFKGLRRLAKKSILALIEPDYAIESSFCSSLCYLFRKGISVCAMCSKKSADRIKLACFNEGISAVIKPENEITQNFSSEIAANGRIGILTMVACTQSNEATFEKLTKLVKFSEIVYLYKKTGIISKEELNIKSLSFRRAKIISGYKSGKGFNLALRALSVGIPEIALIDGRQERALAYAASGNGYIGTVIKQGKGRRA